MPPADQQKPDQGNTTMTNPKNAAADINALLDLDVPVIMLGQPGVGKSDIARQIAAMRDIPIIDFRATLIDPVDLHGLPVADKESGTAK
jgi:MoxR-like ATPase